jgi:hypothetical protein
MAEGGGFCEIHGPFDPPHTECPYCAIEDKQRRAYGPPPTREQAGRPAAPPDEDFVHRTVEPDAAPEPDSDPSLTELVPRVPAEPEPPAEPEEDAGPPAPVGWLVIKEPLTRRGEIIRIEPNQSIGREADIRWDDPRLSRQHARLTLEPPEDDPDALPVFFLWPYAPTNPVYINGRQIRGATPLHENDEIRLGDTLFVFKVLMD